MSNIVVYAIFSFSTSVADAILALLFFHLMMRAKPVPKCYKAVWVAIFGIHNVTFDLLGIFFVYKSLMVVLWCFVYCLFAMKQDKGPSAFFSIFFVTLFYVFENVTVGIAKVYFDDAMLAALHPTLPYQLFVMTGSRSLLFVFVGILLLLLRRKQAPDTAYLKRPYWILLCAGTCAFGSVVVLFDYSLTMRPELTATVLHVLSFLFIIVTILFLFLFVRLARESEKKFQMQTELAQTAQQLQQQDELYTMYNKLQGLRHDYRNHLLIVANLAENEQKDKLLQYLNGIHETFARNDIHTGCPYVDAVMNSKLALASAHGITVELELYFPDQLKIEPADLCACLFNLFDNAIQACDKNQRKENKHIHFLVEQWRGFLRVICTNPSENAPIPFKNTYKSTKLGGLHGIGLRQLEKNAEKYGGVFEAHYEEGTFTANLLLPHPVETPKLFISNLILEPKGEETQHD